MTNNVVSFDEALKIMLHHAANLTSTATQTEHLLGCNGRVLAEEVKSDRDQPPFDRSTRDGFAVRASEASNGALRVVGQVRAGELWTGGALERGTTIEIMTGAPMPQGTDAVVMLEHVTRDEDTIRLNDARTMRIGENVVPRGSEA